MHIQVDGDKDPRNVLFCPHIEVYWPVMVSDFTELQTAFKFLRRWPLHLLGMKFSHIFHLVPILYKNSDGQETWINDLKCDCEYF